MEKSFSLTGDFYFNTDVNILITGNNGTTLQIGTYSKTNNAEYTKSLNSTSPRDIKVIQLVQNSDTVNQSDTTFYVILNKGLSSGIKPNDYLRLYSPTFVKSTISGENMLSETKKIGHI